MPTGTSERPAVFSTLAAIRLRTATSSNTVVTASRSISGEDRASPNAQTSSTSVPMSVSRWGDDVQHNVVIAGADPVAVDVVGSRWKLRGENVR